VDKIDVSRWFDEYLEAFAAWPERARD